MNDHIVAKDWLELARKNYDVAKFLYETLQPKRLSAVFNACQASAETSLKGYLCAKGLNIPKDFYDAAMVCRHCAEVDPAFENFIDGCGETDRCANGTWYPPAIKVTSAQAKRSLKQTLAVYNLVSDRIQELIATKTENEPRNKNDLEM